MFRTFLIWSCSLLMTGFGFAQWQSQIVIPEPDGSLTYVADSLGNQIPDFSFAGYMNSREDIPDLPQIASIAPISGDNTANIQNAINALASMPLDSSGFRGALLLEPGMYEIQGQIRLNISGVVLRGSGDQSDSTSNTILFATGNIPAQRDVLIAGSNISSMWSDSVAGTTQNIISDTVWVGAKEFKINDTSPFSVGDNIVIHFPCTEDWLAAIDSGGTFSHLPGAQPGDLPWAPGSLPIIYNRYITEISSDTIKVDAPVFNTLIRSLGQAKIYKYRRSFLRTKIGIENLRISIDTSGDLDEDHAWNGIYLNTVEDSWVRNCTVEKFGQSGIYSHTASRITIDNCRAIDPDALIEGGRRYNFNAYHASQLILYKNCHASDGRHSYMSNGTSSASGIVFLDCTSEGAYAASEGHRQWSQGILFDNHREIDAPRNGFNPRRIGLYNRGFFGTSHGWSAVHSVAWNCDVNGAEIHVQKPPTAQNYAIGCKGIITGASPPNSFDVEEGFIEGSNVPGLEPRSLFYAQLQSRGVVVGINEDVDGGALEQSDFQLFQNYPNPFNPVTTIAFDLSESGAVQLTVFDIAGKLVEQLFRGHLVRGHYRYSWDGNGYASGVYFYHLKTQHGTDVKKMLLIR